MNSSHTYITAVVILIAFMSECNGAGKLIQFPRDVPVMRRFVQTLRSERNNQIKTEEEKSI